MVILFNFLLLTSLAPATPAPTMCTPELWPRPRFAPIDDPRTERWQRFGRRLRVYWDGREDRGRRVLVYWDAEPGFTAVHKFLADVALPTADVRANYAWPNANLDSLPRPPAGPAWRALALARARAWWRTRETVAMAKYELDDNLILWMLPGSVENALGIEVSIETLFEPEFGQALARLMQRSTTPAMTLDEAGTHVFALKDGLSREMADYVSARQLTP